MTVKSPYKGWCFIWVKNTIYLDPIKMATSLQRLVNVFHQSSSVELNLAGSRSVPVTPGKYILTKNLTIFSLKFFQIKWSVGTQVKVEVIVYRYTKFEAAHMKHVTTILQKNKDKEDFSENEVDSEKDQ